MKTRALLFVAGLFAAGFAAQDPVSFARTYKEGDVDNFQLSVSASMPIGTANMTLKMREMVKKVYENGDADVETLVSDVHNMILGQEIPSGAEPPKPTVERRDKFGQPVGGADAAASKAGQQMAFLRAAMVVNDKPLAVGATVDIDRTEQATGTHTWGKATLEKVESGIATIVSDLQRTMKETGDKPVRMQFRTQIDTASTKMVRVDGTVTNLPSDKGVAIDSITLRMERLK